ncbi:YidH family protein [Halobacillus sp. H74]|uniref:YidH family protein n=1 Tax=Halobacillus sp. H74 TaxID=3457436 RepID=UPI003FCE0258
MDEQKLIQQHLANERTYLAWIRTSIALVGVGFLATTVHMTALPDAGDMGNKLAILVSIVSLFLGIMTIVGATINYYQTRKNINESRFASSHRIIAYMTTVALLLVVLVSAYLLFV